MSNKIKAIIVAAMVAIIGTITGVAVNININLSEEEAAKVNATIEYSSEEIPAVIEDRGEVIETTEYDGEQIPTVEEVDGGKFEDKDTGVSATEGEYEDLGWSETYDTSSPEAFKNATLGRCIIANNRYGAQCVSLARVFWWSYANRDVSTCGTGMAKGMMNCVNENAGDDFLAFWGSNGIQAGDWIIFDGGQYGHVGMALGPVVNGYVALLGENQGGRSCGANVGGSATNIINISVKNVIGYYRPKAYIAPEPEPEPEPTPEPVIDKCLSRTVVKGDTLGAIMKECEGEIKWGESMNEYGRSWVSKTTGLTVFYGWTHDGGVGLFVGDTIERK